ncbi:MAG: DUF86 domain-containing protein [Acidobacteria bacterium]|nr:MAG: DUF86 domain-containing protein [Acidobacteriota bacterium]
MPRRDWRFRIQDILDAIAAVSAYTADMDFEQFTRDRRTVDAVVRNLILIGEAARHIPDEIGAKCSTLPWSEMRAMRNLVVHQYFGVSDAIVWETVKQDLPSIVQPLLGLLMPENH